MQIIKTNKTHSPNPVNKLKLGSSKPPIEVLHEITMPNVHYDLSKEITLILPKIMNLLYFGFHTYIPADINLYSK